MKQLAEMISDDLRDNPKNQRPISMSAYLDEIKSQVRSGDGYGSIYIISFARGRDPDEDKRGILTLWDRYTNNKGYCLQFDEDSVNNMIRYERGEHTYAWIELVEVTYNIDRHGSEFGWLAEQFSLRLLEYMYRSTHDSRLAPDYGRMAV